MRWPDGIHCPHCGPDDLYKLKNHKPQPYRCREAITAIGLSYRIYLMTTSLKGVSSMKLHRDLNMTQKSAWMFAHKIREAFDNKSGGLAGPVETDEAYVGRKRKNMGKAKARLLLRVTRMARLRWSV